MVLFTQLAEARRASIQAVIEQFTVAILSLLPDGEPDILCSGFLLRLDDELVLITAGHALATERAVLHLATGEVATLDNPAIFASETLKYNDPANDIASVLLTPTEAADVNVGTIAPLSALAPFEYRAPEAAYMTMGFRDIRQSFDHVTRMLNHQQTSIMVGAADDVLYKSAKIRREEILLVGAHPASFRGPNGRGGVPKFRGMSGSPVFRYNPHEEYSLENVPPLVGMFIGEPAHTKKALMAVRIGIILEHLELAYPRLAYCLPKFRAPAS